VSPEPDVASGPLATAAPRDPGSKPGPAAAQGRPGPAGPWKAGFFALMVAAIAAAAIWALLGSSLLIVRSVTVTGDRTVTRAQVLQAADIKPGTPLARVNTAVIARRVAQLTQVQSARVSRHWPDAVTIAVTDRTPALAVAVPGRGYAVIDRFGVVLSYGATRPPGLTLLAAPASLASLRGDPAIRAAVTVLTQVPPQVRRLVRSVAAPSPDEVTLNLRKGVKVVWGDTSRPAAKAAELAILMRTRANTYDVSDPDTAVTGG
jgi:cell division protein FtsQ